MSGCGSEPVASDDQEVSEWLGRSDEGVQTVPTRGCGSGPVAQASSE
jgi:hypothetical protein